LKPTRPILEADEQALQYELDEMHMHVSHALDKALQSLRDYDVDIAAQVVADDHLINTVQRKIENNCIRTIALQQPVAGDLRKLMTDIFVSMELERIADHAVAIARIVLKLEGAPDAQYIRPISQMADKCSSMLKIVMQSYDEADEQLARNIAAMDDEIDRAEQEFNDVMFRELCSVPDHKIVCTYLLWVAHNLERIGDRATNIAERVVYMTTSVLPDLNH
jgi:phosphate transport system protein